MSENSRWLALITCFLAESNPDPDPPFLNAYPVLYLLQGMHPPVALMSSTLAPQPRAALINPGRSSGCRAPAFTFPPPTSGMLKTMILPLGGVGSLE